MAYPDNFSSAACDAAQGVRDAPYSNDDTVLASIRAAVQQLRQATDAAQSRVNHYTTHEAEDVIVVAEDALDNLNLALEAVL